MKRYSESLICVFKTYLYKKKNLKSKIYGLWFLSHHSGGFDLSHEVSISISWWSLLCSSGRRERCECGTGLRSIKTWWGLVWTSRIGWCHMSSWSWILIQHMWFVVWGTCSSSCDLQPSKRRSSCCGGKSSSPPQLLQRHTYNKIHWKFLKHDFFVEISVDPQNYRSFPPSFLAGRCWRGDARCQPVRTGALECEARTYLDSSMSQGLLMATRNPVNSPVEVGSLFQYLRRVFFYMPSG